MEGPTDDPQVLALRARQMRNLMATLLLSQGVPMLQAGDERGRTQQGNNNAYCQDNQLSWVDWSRNPQADHMLLFTRQLLEIRRRHPVLRRRRFFHGRRLVGSDIEDLVWLRPDGQRMSEVDWHKGWTRCLGMLLNGEVMTEWSESGELLHDDVLLVLLNSHWEDVTFNLNVAGLLTWQLMMDTRWVTPPEHLVQGTGGSYLLGARSLVLLRRTG